MNTQLIENLIKSCGEPCSGFIFSNPLLDKNVSRTVSKGLIKTLNITNANVNNDLRILVLQNIRKLCKTEPDGHLEIDENLTEILISSYLKQFTKSAEDLEDLDRELDLFLVRKSHGACINSTYYSNVNPEVVQAMLNLNNNAEFIEILSKEISFWNINERKCTTVIQNLWDKNKEHETFYDYVSIKVKSKFETVLLNVALSILRNQSELDSIQSVLLSDNDLKYLIKACSISAVCFQILICILNSLFIATHFNSKIEKFISLTIQYIKSISKVTVSTLYPPYLSSLVVLLDIHINDLPYMEREHYVKVTKKHLKILHDKSEESLIMLLSHYPWWFDIYF